MPTRMPRDATKTETVAARYEIRLRQSCVGNLRPTMKLASCGGSCKRLRRHDKATDSEEIENIDRRVQLLQQVTVNKSSE